MSQHPAYLPALVYEAGINRDSIRCVEPTSTGVTNRTSLVVLQDDTRYILREYAWPYATSDNLHRVEKECYLHHLLQQHDVPVPAILAQFNDDSARAAFFEGYGSAPKDPERKIYELAIYLWMADQYLDGEVDEERVLMPTYEAAMRYLGRVDEAVVKIDRALELP